MHTFEGVSPRRRGRPSAPRPVVVQDTCTQARNQLAEWIQQIKREIDGLEVRGEHAEARKRLDVFAGLLRAKRYVEADDATGDTGSATEALLKTRNIRKSYEVCSTFSERLRLIYIELVRFVEKARITDKDLLFALEMLCHDYDDNVENLSMSWAPAHAPWRGQSLEEVDADTRSHGIK